MNKKKIKADIILISALLLISLTTLLLLKLSSKQGQTVIVKVDGIEVERHSLSSEGTYSLNGGTNILVIKDGYAYLIEADCPDKLCVNQGRIHYTGECITCLPNKLTVNITGEDNGGVDIVS